MAQVVELTAKGLELMDFLKANDGVDLTTAMVAEHIGWNSRAVTGTFNALVKNGVAVRDVIEDTVEGENGRSKKVKTTYLRLTDLGREAELVEKVAKKAKKECDCDAE